MQAVLIWAVVPLQAWLVGLVVGRVTALPVLGRWIGVEAFAVTVLCFVLSDIAAWLVVGFDGLGGVLRWTAPAALVTGLALGTRQLRARAVRSGRALVALALGFGVAAVAGGPFLR